MRLARMTGAQALTAVTGPGGKLVNDEMAQAIVRFIGGGTELERAEVEPSLLSLVCRELNTARLAQGRAEISPTSSRAPATPFSPSSTSAPSPTNPPACARSSRTSCSPTPATARASRRSG